MRHIPEEELHAYLDQALSRTQCVEIESHLAGCARCHDLRNAIAALRDRTTALLARIGPPTTFPPPFEIIRRRHAVALDRRRRVLVRGAWAASLLIGAFMGWEGNRLAHPAPQATMAALPSRPTGQITPAVETSGIPLTAAPAAPSAPTQLASSHTPYRTRRSTRERSALATGPTDRDTSVGLTTSYVRAGDGREQASLDVSALNPAGWQTKPELDGLWRTLPLDEGNETAKTRMPLVSGVPVVQVQVQRGNAEDEVTAVDQQLASGEYIRTIEGPALQVSDLMTRMGRSTPMTDTSNNDDALASGSIAPRPDATLTLRQGNRMVVVTGPSNVLHSLMSRVQVRGWH